MLVSHSFEDVHEDVQVYWPEYGRRLENGNLLVPFSGGKDGERVDGRIEVATDHPHYAAWLEVIQNAPAILEAQEQQRKYEREQRRNKARERRQEESR
jgi:hypothetical protein